MADLISGFKMFGKAPYEQVDSRVFTEVIIDGIRNEEKIYGPVFTATLIKYALRAVAKLTGEEPSKEIKTLDELAEYLISKSDKYPPYYIVIWAQFVTEKKLEGHLGAGERVMDIGISKRVMASDGDLRSELIKGDLGNVILKFYQTVVELKIAPLEMGYKKNEDGTVDVLHRDCFLLDGCQLSLNASLSKRPDGRQVCGFAASACQYLRKATGHDWDYTVLVFDKPHCIAKCYTL
nr:hypothetical protein [Candidatus Freyarchaeota archaeon]